MSRFMARLALATLLLVCLSAATEGRRHRSRFENPSHEEHHEEHHSAAPQSEPHHQQSETTQPAHHGSHSQSQSHELKNQYPQGQNGQGENVMGQTYSKEVRDLWLQKRADRLRGAYGYDPLDLNSNPVRQANIDRYSQIYGNSQCPAEECGNNAQDKALAALAAGHNGFVPEYQSFTDKTVQLQQHELGVGSACTTSADCASSKCVLLKCRECITHGDCDHDSYCTLYSCAPRKPDGHYCGTIDECLSNHCVLFKCAACEDEQCYRTSFRSD